MVQHGVGAVTVPEKLAEKFCREELTAYKAYQWLAARERDPVRRSVLEEMAAQERSHYEFWRRMLGRDCRPRRLSLMLLGLAYRILGPIFTLKMLERGEEEAIREYTEALRYLKGEDRRRLEEIIEDERNHEAKLLEGIEDVRVKYLGYIALGLADAIVEITGVHAGFLGATSSTILAGVAGLVVGFSAALSMSGAAYLQAKHGRETRPIISAGVTGIAYIASVVLLALPYFIFRNMAEAFTASLLLATLVVGSFTYFSTVVQDKPFLKEFLESLALMLGTAFGSFLFGKALGTLLGVEHVM